MMPLINPYGSLKGDVTPSSMIHIKQMKALRQASEKQSQEITQAYMRVKLGYIPYEEEAPDFGSQEVVPSAKTSASSDPQSSASATVGFFTSIGNFIENVGSGISDFFSGLFGGSSSGSSSGKRVATHAASWRWFHPHQHG